MIVKSEPNGFQPDQSPLLTEVELIWLEDCIEHWIRFGRSAADTIIDRARRVLAFPPGSVFALVRWASNDFGTIFSRIDIVRAVETGDTYQTLPSVRPGAEILLRISAWPKVERVLRAIDTVEALGIEAADVAPDYWRHAHNRLSVGLEPRPYQVTQHRAWLLRRRLAS